MVIYENELEKARQNIKKRDKESFESKKVLQTLKENGSAAASGGAIKVFKGCNCKASGCRLAYCDCHKANIKCSDKCGCTSCCNQDPGEINVSPPFKEPYSKRPRMV